MPFVRLIRSAGIVRQIGPKCFFVVRSPIELTDGEKSVRAYPSSGFKISYTISFDHPLIQTQSYSLTMSEDRYEDDICNARTFGFLHEVEYMKRLGLARGGTLDNAVVIDKNQVLNPGGLRYADEFVRHKILDSIGDISLLGMPMMGHLVIQKSGHAFNYAFLKEFFKRKDCWETLTVHDISGRSEYYPRAMAV
jgi:UDP-3-O-[3-hydroxymyristoyl] N-acetylglucosamine deacetylase